MSQYSKHQQEEPSVKELLQPYTRKWFWFGLSVFFSLIFTFIFLRYTPSQYETNATVLIKDKADNGFSADLDPFRNLGIFKRFSKGKLENELAILESRRIISRTVEKLNFNVKYELEGRVMSNEIYPNPPLQVAYVINEDSLKRNSEIPVIRVTVLSKTQYELEDEEDVIGVFNFGDKVTMENAEFTITPSVFTEEGMEPFINNTYIITYRNTLDIALSYQKALEILYDIENSSDVVTLSLKTRVKKKAEDFINELVRQYNLDAAEDENQISLKTAKFLDSRIDIILKGLDSVETDKEEFKVENKLTSIEVESQIVLQGATEYNNRQVELFTQLEVVESLIDYLKNSDEIELLPANTGLEGGEINSAIDYYNQLVLERNRFLRNSTAQNPIVVNIETQIKNYRVSIIEALNNKKEALNTALSDFNQQENKYISRLSQVPTQEKHFRDIVRQQEIKEELYIFLLKQREQASIKLATTTVKARLIDVALSSNNPIFPKKEIFYLGGLLIGLLIPFSIIYVSNLLKTSVANRKDVEKELKGLSLIGEIPKIKGDANQIIQVNDRSVLAESFRILRTNLQYFFVNKISNENSKSIFITSTIKGEGKTLVAFNLSLTLSYTGKKVALVGADIRNPQLQRYIPKEMRKHQGLTEFIMRENLSVKDVIVPTEYKNLDVVLSGVIPPNPAELLLQDRVTQFFDELKENYDYVIVDTAPTMLVTDTLLISKFSDVILYVIKANYTDKKLLEFPKDAIEDGRLNNVALVLNGVTMNNFGYGNKYGYAYSKEKPSLKERLFG